MKFISTIEGKRLVINDSDLTKEFITFLKNTTTENTHASNSFGTAGANGTSLFDLWHLAKDDNNYTLTLSAYDGLAFIASIELFLFIHPNPLNYEKIAFEMEKPRDFKIKSHENETVSIFTGERLYGDLTVNAEYVKKIKNSIEQTPYQEAIYKLMQLNLSKQLRSKVNDFLLQIKNLHDPESEAELTDILKQTYRLLTEKANLLPEYQDLARKVQGYSSPGWLILGGLMMAIGASVALLGAACLAGVDLGVSLVAGASVFVGGAAFFAKGRQHGLSKSMSDILNTFEPEQEISHPLTR